MYAAHYYCFYPIYMPNKDKNHKNFKHVYKTLISSLQYCNVWMMLVPFYFKDGTFEIGKNITIKVTNVAYNFFKI